MTLQSYELNKEKRCVKLIFSDNQWAEVYRFGGIAYTVTSELVDKNGLKYIKNDLIKCSFFFNFSREINLKKEIKETVEKHLNIEFKIINH